MRRSCCGLGRSWAVLGRPWGGLVPSCAVLGWSWSGLGRSWAISGRSWSRLGGILGRFMRHLGVKNIDFPCVFQYFLRICIFHILSLPKPSWKPTWVNLELQEPPKRSPGAVLADLGTVLGGLGSVLGWSWGCLGAVLGGQSGADLGKKSVQKPFYVRDCLWMRFWIDFGLFGGRIGEDLGSIWGGFGVDLVGFFLCFAIFLEVAL